MAASNLDFEALTKGLPSKSEKIRTLGRAGATPSEIAHFLGIRYQFARNVLVDAGLRGVQRNAADDRMSGKVMPHAAGRTSREGQDAKSEEAEGLWLRIAHDGTVQLPARLLAAAEIKPGSQLYARLNGATVELFAQKEALRRAQEIVSRYVPPGVSLVDELIADRRAESRREEGKL